MKRHLMLVKLEQLHLRVHGARDGEGRRVDRVAALLEDHHLAIVVAHALLRKLQK